MVIEAAARRRDMLAWQVARGVRDKGVTCFADLRGDGSTAGSAVSSPGAANARNLHAFRLWKRAMKRLGAKGGEAKC